MPFRKKGGFLFTVHENNVILPNHVMGRAYVTHEDALEYMRAGESPVLDIGKSIGSIKVKLIESTEFKKEGSKKYIPLEDLSIENEDTKIFTESMYCYLDRGGSPPVEPSLVTETYLDWVSAYTKWAMVFLLSLRLTSNLGIKEEEGKRYADTSKKYTVAKGKVTKLTSSGAAADSARTNDTQSSPASKVDGTALHQTQPFIEKLIKSKRPISMKGIMKTRSERKNQKNNSDEISKKSARKCEELEIVIEDISHSTSGDKSNTSMNKLRVSMKGIMKTRSKRMNQKKISNKIPKKSARKSGKFKIDDIASSDSMISYTSGEQSMTVQSTSQ
eukprot:CAMPEP_0194099426 /NCGR_PEP_ID=MMETSP0150-20130528/607_1 /TAXON_ID=122233 /ORGANISM="Chaetoceros debilis, Strain MM31A-1" /LENGTH=330 /DNA_ID=CAMNT_0038785631 /DNA_START=305 /DNA_END=1297 /DNA_ORIENTATION=-